MTVKLLRALLDAISQDEDHLEVSVVCTNWPGREFAESPPQPIFRIASVVMDMDPDTAKENIKLECDQRF